MTDSQIAEWAWWETMFFDDEWYERQLDLMEDQFDSEYGLT